MHNTLTPTTTGSTATGQHVAYLRVSSEGQSLDRQTELTTLVTKTFTETASASTRHRPVLAELLTYVRAGDTIHVWSMDRLARSLADLMELITELNTKRVSVTFHKEALTFAPDHDDAMSTLLMQVMGAVAQFERSLIRQRQAEGIAKAKQRGVYKGRQPTLTVEQIATARQQIDHGVPKARVARELGVARQTLYRALAKS